jgi:ATP-dependent RNA helicase RhlE
MNDQSFSSLGLADGILSALDRQGYKSPTPIQSASIPALLAGKDLLGCAQTGTGKTAAFALPIIQRLSERPVRLEPRACRTLVVAPTRELAAQIDASFDAYGANSRVGHTCVFGGVGKAPQIKALSRGVDVLIATPGRLLDLHSEKQVRLDKVEIVVLDEADRMLDMGFIRDVRKIMALLPRERQTLLFSATMPNDISGLANSILRDPVRVSVSPEKPAVELIDQTVAFVGKGEKRFFLASLIKEQGAERAIVFTRTKHGADKLARSLSSSGIPAEAIHANKSQNKRTRTMEEFRSGALRVLVATDLAARGIDVDGVSHVYNYELPEVAETYVHRIGRTARAGASGVAVALCDGEEKPLLRAIEKLLRRGVPVAAGEVFERAAAESRKAAAAEAAAPKPVASRHDGQRRDAAPRRDARGAQAGRRTGRGESRVHEGERKPRTERNYQASVTSSSGTAQPRRQPRPQSSRPAVARSGRSPFGEGERFSIEDVTGYNGRPGSYSGRR